jgi:chromosome segregation ATPase
MIELTPDETHYEKYLDVAMMLLSSPEEVSPSARALVERLGGSLTTANKAMQVFWRYVGRRLAYQQQYPQGMPGPIIKLTEQLMASAREAAAQELEEEKTRLVQREQKILEQAASLEATIDSQQQALAQANEQLMDCQRERDEQTAKAGQLCDELEDKNSVLATLGQDNANLLQQLSRQSAVQQQADARIRKLEQDRTGYRGKISTLNERLVNSEKKVILLDAQRQHKAMQIDDLKATLDDSQAAQAQQAEKATQSQARIEDLRSDCVAATTRLSTQGDERQQLLDSNQQLQAALDTQQSEQQTLAKTVHKLQLEHGRLEAHLLRMPVLEQQIADLRGERDRLLAWMAKDKLNTDAERGDATRPAEQRVSDD